MISSITKKDLSTRKIDFMDFGASKAQSLEYGVNHFFGKKGLGLDIDSDRVRATKKTGYECVTADLTKVILPAKSVKFVKMAHILEHMPDLKAVERVIKLGAETATDFLVITGPYFDADEYLASKGFKLHWSDYPDHPCHLKVSQLIGIIDRLALDSYEIYLRYPINDSSNEHVHPLDSPPWSHSYDPNKHPKKKYEVFKESVWVDFVCYIKLRKLNNWEKITAGYRHQIPFIEVHSGKKTTWSAQAINSFIKLDRAIIHEEERADKEGERANTLQVKVETLKKELDDIRNSSSWRVARNLQRGSFVAKNPKEAFKHAKRKLNY